MIHLRRLQAADAAEARRLLDAILPDAWRDGPLSAPEAYAEALGDPRAVLIAAFAGTDPAGYVSGRIDRSLTRPGDTAMLDDLLVAPSHRGRGLGTALVRAFRDEALARGRRPLAMWAGTGIDNIPARRAFEATGGRPIGETYLEHVWETAR